MAKHCHCRYGPDATLQPGDTCPDCDSVVYVDTPEPETHEQQTARLLTEGRY